MSAVLVLAAGLLPGCAQWQALTVAPGAHITGVYGGRVTVYMLDQRTGRLRVCLIGPDADCREFETQ